MKTVKAGNNSTCESCSNRAVSVFCNFAGKAAEQFQSLRHTIHYHSGQFVFYEGHPVLGLYILCAGRVKLMRSTRMGQQRVVGIIDPGHLIEKHTFRDDAVHQMTCEALEPSQICLVDRAKYLDLLKDHGQVAVEVIKHLSHEMGQSLGDTDQYAFASARERLAKLLLDLAGRYGESTPRGVRITLSLKREELAQMTAMTVETAVRLLQALQAQQIIEMNGRDIVLLQMDRLDRLARKTLAT